MASGFFTRSRAEEYHIMEHDATSSFFNKQLPKEFLGKVAIHEGIFHISDDLKGNPNLGALILHARKHNVRRTQFHPPADFASQFSSMAIRAKVEGNELQKFAVDLLQTAYERKASDIHIINMGTYALIKMRTLGLLSEYKQLPADTGTKLITMIFDSFGQETGTANFSPLKRLDARIVKPEVLPIGVHSIRIHTEPIQSEGRDGGNFMALRLLFDATRAQGTLDDRMSKLGFDKGQIEVLNNLCKRGGLSLISGPTGHGKSTFLKHIMESMVENQPQKSYFSVEDPPEYPIRGICQIQVNTGKKDSDAVAETHIARAAAYNDAIAGAMRSDPDVIMIGEIRYGEAADAAINAALTGHGVWATIHASDSFAVVTRLEGLLRQARVNNPLDAICDANVLSGLCYQRLIPILCPECKKKLKDVRGEERSIAVSPDLEDRLNAVMTPEQFGEVCVRGDGCEYCNHEGNIGLTVAAETVQLDNDMLKHLRNGDKLKARRQWREMHRGMSYVEHAIRKIGMGISDPTDAETRLGVPITHAQTFYQQEDM